MPRPADHPPIVSLGPAWDGVGLWGDGILRCSRGDCRHYRPGGPRLVSPNSLPVLVTSSCGHPDGGDTHLGTGGEFLGDTVALCVPFYRELTRRYASIAKGR
jgi:hypothetical protein